MLLYFNWEKKEYEKIPVREQVEVAAMIGDVADDPKGKPALHVHIVLGTRDGSAAPRSYCPWHPRVPIYRATHQVAALHEAIEGYADIQFANIAPAPTGIFSGSKSPCRLPSEPKLAPSGLSQHYADFLYRFREQRGGKRPFVTPALNGDVRSQSQYDRPTNTLAVARSTMFN